MFVQGLQVLQPDVELVLSVALLYLLNQLGDIRFQVDKQVGRLNKVDHGVKDIQIALIVPVADMSAFVQVGRKYIGVLIDGSVLNDGLITVPDLVHLIKTAVEEINLQMKGPSGHVRIEILQVGIMIYRFIQWSPSIMSGKSFSKGGFSGTNIAGNGDVSEGWIHGFNLGNWISQRLKSRAQILRKYRSSQT